MALRGFTYQAIGQLSQRVPLLFQEDTDIAARCFEALSFEPAGVKAAVQEATSLLSAAYHPDKLQGTAVTSTVLPWSSGLLWIWEMLLLIGRSSTAMQLDDIALQSCMLLAS